MQASAHDHSRDDSRDEDPLESDQHGVDVVDVVPCPYCGKRLVESAEVCPKCGSYVLREDFASAGRPRWLVVTAVVLMAAFVLGYVLL